MHLPTRPISFSRRLFGQEPTGHCINVNWFLHQTIGRRRHLINIIRDVDKTSILHPLRHIRRHVHALPELAATLVQFLLPIQQHGRLLVGPVIGTNPRLILLELEPTAGLEMLVRLAQQALPVGDATAETAGVNVVKSLVGGEGPVALGVVDVEGAVGRSPVGLDGTEIGADDVGVGEVLCHLEGPGAGTGADVEDAAGFAPGANGGAVEVTAGEELEEMVHEGETVLLFLVVGDGVLAVPVGVVPSTILITVVSHGGGEGEVGIGDGLGIAEGVFITGLVELIPPFDKEGKKKKEERHTSI